MFIKCVGTLVHRHWPSAAGLAGWWWSAEPLPTVPLCQCDWTHQSKPMPQHWERVSTTMLGNSHNNFILMFTYTGHMHSFYPSLIPPLKKPCSGPKHCVNSKKFLRQSHQAVMGGGQGSHLHLHVHTFIIKFLVISLQLYSKLRLLEANTWRWVHVL